jgi:hypothetical protein
LPDNTELEAANMSITPSGNPLMGVARDTSLTGTGTAGLPLGVAAAHRERFERRH